MPAHDFAYDSPNYGERLATLETARRAQEKRLDGLERKIDRLVWMIIASLFTAVLHLGIFILWWMREAH